VPETVFKFNRNLPASANSIGRKGEIHEHYWTNQDKNTQGRKLEFSWS